MYALLGALALAAPAAAGIMRSEHESGNSNNPHRSLLRREITTDVNAALGRDWDFIIAGGGLAGLTIASRLSEWDNTTVLVIEAGTDGSEVPDEIAIPGYSYLQGLSGKAQDWQYQTVAQANAGGSQKKWPRGKVLGGSGAINGMFWGRGCQEDYDAWATLNPNGNQTWNWDEVNKYIMKAENFSSPKQENIDTFHMPVDPSFHGQDGPIHATMSEWIYPAVANWVPSWQSLGFDAKDLNGGNVRGVMICPSTLNIANQTRSDSKAGYIDTLPPRSNLMILTGQQVTQVNFNGTKDGNGNIIASGVSFAAPGDAELKTVNAKKEVILAGGTIGSAQILQLSGVGPKDVLAQQSINVNLDLPVGYNLQDHVSNAIYYTVNEGVDTWTAFSKNTTDMAASLTQWRESHTGKWTYINEAVGYVSMADIQGGASQASTAANNIKVQDLVNQFASSWPSSVQSGLTKQYNIMKEFLTQDVGQLEIIFTMYSGAVDQIGIQVAVQHPFSRGSIMINSNNPFAQPSIDPAYLTAQIDNDVALGGLLFARKLGNTSPLKDLMKQDLTANLNNNDLLNSYKQYAGTEYHPCGTCSMLPQEDGGVVDTNLLVYGTSNVRVIDASIIPLHVSAHLMATTYGIAEKGSDIIKQLYATPPPAASTTTSASSTGASSGTASDAATTSGSGDATGAHNNASDSNVLSSGAKLGIGIGAGVGVAALLAAIVSSFTFTLLL